MQLTSADVRPTLLLAGTPLSGQESKPLRQMYKQVHSVTAPHLNSSLLSAHLSWMLTVQPGSPAGPHCVQMLPLQSLPRYVARPYGCTES